MQWYYSDGTSRFGPVSEAEFESRVREGVVVGTTLVWREGMTTWEPWARVGTAGTGAPPVQAGLPPVAAVAVAGTPCVACGRVFTAEELVLIGANPVCAACKPEYLERLREGAPIASGANGTGVYRDKGRLVVEHGAVPPDRCVYCNAPGVWRKKRKFYWTPPWVYLFIFCNLIVLVIVALVVRKTLSFEVVLCGEHAARRRRNLGIAWGLFGAALVTGVASFAVSGRDDLFVAAWITAVCLALAAAIVGVRAASMLSPRRIGNRAGQFSRAGEEYLSRLPEWPGMLD